MNPGSAGQLEVLGEASCEDNAFCWIARIGEPARIADLVETFLIECLCREVGILPIAWCDVRTTDSQLVSTIAIDRDHLEFAAWCRQPKHEGTVRFEVNERDDRRRFRRTPPRADADPLSGFQDRKPFEFVPDMRRQCRGAENNHLQTLE